VWSGDGLASGENGRFDVIDIPPPEGQGKVSSGSSSAGGGEGGRRLAWCC
jgi:hypothetical protein